MVYARCSRGADSSAWSKVSAPSCAAFVLYLWASGLQLMGEMQVSSLQRHACPTSSFKGLMATKKQLEVVSSHGFSHSPS